MASRTHSYANAPRASATTKQFLCYAAHLLPDPAQLASVTLRRQGAYAIRWQKRQLRQCEASSACAVWLGGASVTILPLAQAGLASLDAPYGLAYDQWLVNARKAGSILTHVASYNGFVVFTSPAHDWQRSCMFASLTRYADALLHADRALETLGEHASEITDDIDKQFMRFSKLRNLAIDQYGSAEGLLAARRALSIAERCYQELTKLCE